MKKQILLSTPHLGDRQELLPRLASTPSTYITYYDQYDAVTEFLQDLRSQ